MSNVIIFGAGPSGKRALEANKEQWSIVAFRDNDTEKWGSYIENVPVCAPCEIPSLTYDSVYIASVPGREQIKKQLRELGVEENKIYVYRHCATGCELFIKNFAEDVYEGALQGSVAEVGVFRGDTAEIINKCFPDRSCYLFDTFEGFPALDVTVEQKQHFSEAKENQFNDTTESIVMEKLKYKDTVIIRKGFFPQTAEGIEDTFIFVRLDLDLYQPTLAGLKFFSKRMHCKGVILIHDYYTKSYGGVKQAVIDFFDTTDAKHLYKLPAGDMMSIAIGGF